MVYIKEKNGWQLVGVAIVQEELIAVEQEEAPFFTDYNWWDV